MAKAGGPMLDHFAHTNLDPPPIVAAFLVRFDTRKGYTIAWQRAIDGLQLEGVVDYKSLPSGLHNVEEDVVYFVQEDYVGVSVFLNKPGSESERNARMLAVGVLVPLEQGRMGKSWRHVVGLKKLASSLIENPEDSEGLEEYWQEFSPHKKEEDNRSSPESPIELKTDGSNSSRPDGYQQPRKISTSTTFIPSNPSLSSHHPALSLPNLVQMFGPLIFPLYRAALLRKRILLVGEVPVEQSCNFVYDLSVLSSIPKALLDLLPIDGIPDTRMQSLFTVGVLDIPELARTQQPSESFLNLHQGWIACTTDDVLATKPALFDLLIQLPPRGSEDARTKVFPKLVTSSPDLMKQVPKHGLRSTQRDARRYMTLRGGLRRLPSGQYDPEPAAAAVEDDDDKSSLTSDASSTISRTSVVEPPSWSLVAYTSLIWWASAGEKKGGPREQEEAESEQDAALLLGDGDDEEAPTKEVAIVAYFHRLTSLIFATISDAISRADGERGRRDAYGDDDSDPSESDDGDSVEHQDPLDDSREDVAATDGTEMDSLLPEQIMEDEEVEITQEDMTIMGLDVWSAADKGFVEELTALWWGRKAVIRGGRIDCCGVRIL